MPKWIIPAALATCLTGCTASRHEPPASTAQTQLSDVQKNPSVPDWAKQRAAQSITAGDAATKLLKSHTH